MQAQGLRLSAVTPLPRRPRGDQEYEEQGVRDGADGADDCEAQDRAAARGMADLADQQQVIDEWLDEYATASPSPLEITCRLRGMLRK
jgi:hypothetical protein